MSPPTHMSHPSTQVFQLLQALVGRIQTSDTNMRQEIGKIGTDMPRQVASLLLPEHSCSTTTHITINEEIKKYSVAVPRLLFVRSLL